LFSLELLVKFLCSEKVSHAAREVRCYLLIVIAEA
jgi:hypothetical protein